MDRYMYFAYGSNMNLDQMRYRCPAAEVAGTVRLEDYRLEFCGMRAGGVATIIPAPGEHVEGVLWEITKDCERSLDRYEGYPRLYGKEKILVRQKDGTEIKTMAYVLNPPVKDHLAQPTPSYLKGILEGCKENGISKDLVYAAAKRAKEAAKDHVRRQPDWPVR